jgi:RimJ/RimL family protein N-acetyltransferase
LAVTVLSTDWVEAERVRLRKAHHADIEGVVETQTSERVRRYLGGIRSEQVVRDYLAVTGVTGVTASAGSFVVADLVTDDMLGSVSLSRRGNDRPGHVQDGGGELELSYVFRPCAWGCGYATEAARALLSAAAAELPDQPVLIVTQSANYRSLRLGQRLGFCAATTFEEFEAQQTLGVADLHTFRTR